MPETRPVVSCATRAVPPSSVRIRRTLNQRLVTKKNRKARRLQELHPEVQVKVLYQRDYLHLLVKYGLEPPEQLVDTPSDAPTRLDLRPQAKPGSHAESA